eukprot:TRINITY_DN35112_c0_g1_i1.p1 TRINITY_DN35112_c0_g1~~TRINITY_DN35112_c0_g1_i1.p1  ORF type:complete len:289 (+),score=124.42 TRINITY_DN35112_c0_g1_i1:71-868(+)
MKATRELLKRMPTAKLGQCLAGICKLQPDIMEDVLEEFDQPLKTMACEETGRDFIISDHNRDGDSFRSPFSNKFQPPCEGAVALSGRLRQMEVTANSLFSSYADAYYDGAVSSVFLWDIDNGFAGAVLIKKTVSERADVEAGGWDSIHVFEAEEKGDGYAYTVTTTVMLFLKGASEGVKLGLSGFVTTQRSQEQDEVKDDDEHLRHLGDLIQTTENRLRSSIDQVYFGKSEEITSEVRSKISLQEKQAQADVAEALAKRLAGGEA